MSSAYKAPKVEEPELNIYSTEIDESCNNARLEAPGYRTPEELSSMTTSDLSRAPKKSIKQETPALTLFESTFYTDRLRSCTSAASRKGECEKVKRTDRKMKDGGAGRVLVKVVVGHESELLDKPNSLGHTHRWTLFVRPVPPAKFVDRNFINKVTFKLHPTFNNPVRVVKDPPFEISETGYASFSPEVVVVFNTPNAKPCKFMYDMNLTLEKHGIHEQEQIFEVKEPSAAFAELVRKYCGSEKKKKRESNEPVEGAVASKKMKTEDGSSSRESSKGPRDMKESKEKHREKDYKKDKDREERRAEKRERKEKEKRDSNGSNGSNGSATSKENKMIKEEVPDSDSPRHKKERDSLSLPSINPSNGISQAVRPVMPQRPGAVKTIPCKTDEKKKVETDTSPSSSSMTSGSSPEPPRTVSLAELHQKMITLQDEDLIVRVFEVLAYDKNTKVKMPQHTFTFDLTHMDPQMIAKLTKILF